MFDDISSLENNTEDKQKHSEDKGNSLGWLSRWSPIIAGLLFCLLYFPFQNHRWSWCLAIAVSYSVFAFAIALGLSLGDFDDFFGDSKVPKYVATLFLPHALLLIPITLAAYFWLRLKPILPPWITHEGPKGSWWELCLLLLVFFAGRREGIWMASKIKSRFGNRKD